MLKQQVEESLEELGLTANEARVYLSLLWLKSALAGEITVRSGIHRRNVYDALERLQEQGLVSHTLVNNRRCFQPARPERLGDILRRRQSKLDDALPYLNSLLGTSPEKEGVAVSTGAESYRSLLDDIILTLPHGGEWLSVPMFYRMERFDNFLSKMHARRKAKKIFFKAIYNNNPDGSVRAKQVAALPFTSIRLLPLAKQVPAGINIYGDKCALMVVDKGGVPVVTVFSSHTIANTFKRFFDSLWKDARPLPKA